MMQRNPIRIACLLGAFLALPLSAGLSQGGKGSSAPALTDANIAAIVVGANTIDIEYGKIAQARARNPEVRRFAETMITDHTAVNRQAGELAAKLKLTPVDNETSRKLAADAEAIRKTLQAESGAAFDRAYIANEVAFHQTVLDAIDGALIPNARNAELKALIQAVRPAVAAHLGHAKQLQASLGDR